MSDATSRQSLKARSKKQKPNRDYVSRKRSIRCKQRIATAKLPDRLCRLHRPVLCHILSFLEVDNRNETTSLNGAVSRYYNQALKSKEAKIALHYYTALLPSTGILSGVYLGVSKLIISGSQWLHNELHSDPFRGLTMYRVSVLEIDEPCIINTKILCKFISRTFKKEVFREFEIDTSRGSGGLFHYIDPIRMTQFVYKNGWSFKINDEAVINCKVCGTETLTRTFIVECKAQDCKCNEHHILCNQCVSKKFEAIDYSNWHGCCCDIVPLCNPSIGTLLFQPCGLCDPRPGPPDHLELQNRQPNRVCMKCWNANNVSQRGWYLYFADLADAGICRTCITWHCSHKPCPKAAATPLELN